MQVSLEQSIHSTSIDFERLAPEIQGNILSSHGRDHAAHVFLRFNDAQEARLRIGSHISGRVTSAAKQKIDSIAAKANPRMRSRNFLAFALSGNGYDFLGIGNVPPHPQFLKGMRDSQDRLNDPVDTAWEAPYQKEWHAVMIIAHSSPKSLNNQVQFLLDRMMPAVAEHHIEIGMSIRNKQNFHIEHFGYVDGISQPLLLKDKIDSGEVPTNNWNPRANLDLALVPDPGGTNENAFGSYFIFRKLEQNVQDFNAAVAARAHALGISEELYGAQLVGRFKSGNPLIPEVPPQPDPSGKMNDFNYDDDNTRGSKCPFHAHVRRANPRGTGGREPSADEKRHLFVRRGITYGGDSTSMDPPPTGGVGLLFMCYNNDIAKQFEFMQIAWANEDNDFPFGRPNEPHGVDPIIGQGQTSSGQNHFTTWGDDASEKRETPSFAGFVKMQGGEYFFAPSISFLRSL